LPPPENAMTNTISPADAAASAEAYTCCGRRNPPYGSCGRGWLAGACAVWQLPRNSSSAAEKARRRCQLANHVGLDRRAGFFGLADIARLFLPRDNLVLDLAIDVRRNDLTLCEIVFSVIWSIGDDGLRPRGTHAGKPIEFLGACGVYIDQLRFARRARRGGRRGIR
jgi:hypothetical protein